ncbi:MAG: Rieske (2Fe-2S) protein [Actinomycetes bacterium]
MSTVERRQVLIGTAVVASAVALAACGSGGGGAASSSAAPDPSSESPTGGSGALASTTDVPSGGGVVVESDGQSYVITQPVTGTYKCFSAVCPHQGCNCSKVADGTIDCPCHGSRFAVDTGDVVQGPATTGLTSVPISVSGTSITLA